MSRDARVADELDVCAVSDFVDAVTETLRSSRNFRLSLRLSRKHDVLSCSFRRFYSPSESLRSARDHQTGIKVECSTTHLDFQVSRHVRSELRVFPSYTVGDGERRQSSFSNSNMFFYSRAVVALTWGAGGDSSVSSFETRVHRDYVSVGGR